LKAEETGGGLSPPPVAVPVPLVAGLAFPCLAWLSSSLVAVIFLSSGSCDAQPAAEQDSINTAINITAEAAVPSKLATMTITMRTPPLPDD